MAWPDNISVAVNLSAGQFRNPTLALSVVGALGASGLPASRLELEITETVLLQDDLALLDVLHQMRELGAKISMDDFGTDYSLLSYLRSFPFDKIKIDRSFIRELGKEKSDCVAIIRAVTRLGRSLGMVTTGRRNRGATRNPARRGLHAGAGLSVQPAATGQRHSGHSQKTAASNSRPLNGRPRRAAAGPPALLNLR
jgi:predicted signal transduction protein with EAL and GGDEF domain